MKPAVSYDSETDIFTCVNINIKYEHDSDENNKDKVSKAHLECIKQGKSYPFVGTAEMLQALTDA